MATARVIADERSSHTAEEWTERMLITAMAVNPLVAMDRSQIVAAAGRLVARAALEPVTTGRRTLGLGRELVDVLLGRSDRKPDGSDRRFTDPAFTDHPLYRRLMQGYLAWRASLHALVEDVKLDSKSRERARFAVSLLTEAVAPTNTFLGNPAAIKRAYETAGASVWSGFRHLMNDLVENGGMPSQVDRRPFRVGENLAATPGEVVFRNDVLEVLQYAPATAEVFERPILFVPPQINKYYVLDLAPGRSLVEHAVRGGFTVLAVSWRNPTPAQRDWALGTYVQALLEATDAVQAITGSSKLNVLGACAGGITTAVFLAHLAARGTTA